MSCDMIYIHSLNILCDENTIEFRGKRLFANLKTMAHIFVLDLNEKAMEETLF